MKNLNPIELIDGYKKLISDKDSASLKNLFKEAIEAPFVPFPVETTRTPEKARIFLGYKDNKLYAILVRGTGKFDQSTYTKMKYYIASFSKFDLPKVNSLKEANLSNPNEISFDAFSKRVELLGKECNQWVDENLKNSTFVEYFEITLNNFKNNANNKCVLGLYKDSEKNMQNRIDIITVNDAYMDVTRPVPPFKPTF